MVLPNSNLPPGSAPWERTIVKISDEIDAAFRGSESNVNAMYSGQAATIQLLSQQINALNTQVGTLPIVSSQSINYTSLALGTGTGVGNYTTITTDTFNIPEGKTEAQVMVFGLCDLDFFSTGMNYYYHRVGINGSYDMPSMHGQHGTAGLSCARVVTGPTFTITVQVSATAGASLGSADVHLTLLAGYK